MAGTALLPWEKWIGQLIHAIHVAFARHIHKFRWNRALAGGKGWRQTEGTVESINWDSSLPREEIVFSYSADHGFHSGYFWRWFDSKDQRRVEVGDRVSLRYDPKHEERSVFVSFI